MDTIQNKNTHTLTGSKQKNEFSANRVQSNLVNSALKYSAGFWFITTLLGQWFFFYYIFSFYGFSVINNNMQIWNRWEAMGSTPYIAGDFSGNLAFAAHAIGAGIVAFGGALQLLPQVRNAFPKFHKINGYIYLITVLALSLSGFYLVWVRDHEPLDLSGVGTSINGALILVFAYFTVKTAIAKKIKNHRKWAIRLFLVSNAQWMLRVGVFSYFVTGSLLGLKPAFGDIFFPLWTFGCFVLPLLAAELFFYATEKGSQKVKLLTSTILTLLTVLMALGMLGFTPFLIKVMSGAPITF